MYPGPDRICNIAPPTLMALPRIGDDDLKVVILVQYLLDAAVIASLLLRSSLLDIVLIIIT